MKKFNFISKDPIYTATVAGYSELANKLWLILAFLGRTNLPWRITKAA